MNSDSDINYMPAVKFIDRAAVKEKLASIQGFEGVSGTINMNDSGDPAKSAVVIRIIENGEFESYSSAAP